MRILVAELIGTAVLVIGGPGSAILHGGGIGTLGVALAFGLSLLVMAYAIGNISGCHINPAVTVGLALMRKIDTAKVPFYLIGQFVGAVLGAAVIWIIANDLDGFDASPSNFAVNGWGNLSPGGYGFWAMVVTELVMTALLVFVVLSTTQRGFAPGAVGLTVGLALTLIHLVSIPIDNTSVNPARSLGPALFAGGDAIEQLWAFLVFPNIGAFLGALVWLAISDERLEDTMMGGTPLVELRDRAQAAGGRVAEKADATGD